MLKLGRAQGVAIAAAIQHGVPVHEYAPMKIKMAITGTGSASKEQVAGMLQRILKLDDDDSPIHGCHGCFRGGLLSFYADWCGAKEKKYSNLERLRSEKCLKGKS